MEFPESATYRLHRASNLTPTGVLNTAPLAVAADEYVAFNSYPLADPSVKNRSPLPSDASDVTECGQLACTTDALPAADSSSIVPVEQHVSVKKTSPAVSTALFEAVP